MRPTLDRFHPDAIIATGADHSNEDLLAVDEIQGNILPGFGTEGQILLFLKIDDAPAARRWLRELAPRISTLRQTNEVREVRRAVARAVGRRQALPDVLLNVALSFPALAPLGLSHDQIADGPFREGMASTNLQDPLDENSLPRGWLVGATPDTTPDLLVILGSDGAAALAAAAVQLTRSLPTPGLRLIHRDQGHRLPRDIEHFGFRDGISQPGVRGRLSQRPDHVLTRRHFDPLDPRAATDARPGQPLLWPGQFIFGYPTQLELGPEPGPRARPPEPWMKDGSFLIFRRLRQDVAAFRAFSAQEAPRIAQALGRPVSPDLVEAWLVGRCPDGTPLLRSPEAADPATADDDDAVNFFSFALEDVEPDARVVVDGQARTIPGVAGDPQGKRCPFFAHVRKVNLRDKLSDQGPSFRFRLLRRGIPYGPPVGAGEPADIDRGLLFLAYHRTIDPAFITLSATWMNSDGAPEGFGHDLLVGQNRNGRFADLRDATGTPRYRVKAEAGRAWVIPTGGGFFFAPAVSVFAQL
jgi:Dyp-type peroxidase family